VWQRGPAYLNQHIYKVIPRNDNNLRFLHHLLNWLIDPLANQSHGTTMKHVTRGDLLPYPVTVPSPTEQSRIAAVLDAVDEAIAKTEAVIAKLKQVRAGLLHDLLTRGLDENGQLRDPIAHPEQFQDSPIGRIPRGWEVLTIGELNLEIVDGDRGFNYPNESQLFDQGFCVFLNNKNIFDGKINFYYAKFISQERDVLLGKGKLNLGDIIITTRGTVGNIALFNSLHPYQDVRINSGMIIIRNYENIFVPHFFVELWKFLFISEYRRLSSGSAQPQFPIRDIKQSLISANR
jgi:type I restriction enzyme S subunit